MEIQTEEHSADVGILNIEGDIDIYNTSDLKRTVNELIDGANKKHIIFNLGGVPYIDSSGIGALIATLTKLKKSGGTLKIVNPQDSVRKVFELTKMTSFFDIFDKMEDALAKV